MFKSACLVLIFGVLVMSACTPVVVVVTPTEVPLSPTPIVVIVTATPQYTTTASPAPTQTRAVDTLTREALNPHAACLLSSPPEQCVVNENAYLDGPYSTREIAGRTVQAPLNWTVVRDGGLPAWPDVRCAAGDCVVSADSLSGKIGLRGGGVAIYPGQRYLLVLRYSFQCNPRRASELNLTTVRPSATLYTSGPASTTQLPEGALQRASGYNEAMWVLESDKRLSDLVIEAWWHIPFGICGENAALTWHSVELLPVASDYGSSSVIRF